MQSVSCTCTEDGNDTLVSVVIVTHNRKGDVREAIHSVCVQTHPRFEILLVDNGSSDGTCQMVREEFPHVRTTELARNVGPSAARNIGVDNSSGEVLFFLDDDATLAQDVIETIVARFSRERELGVIVCKILDFFSHEPEWRLSGHLAGYHNKEFYLGDLTSEGATAIRREVFRRAGGWPAHLFQYGEGRDMSYRILQQGFRMLYYPDALAYHKSSPFLGVSREEIARRRVFLTVRNDIWIAWTYLPVVRALAETAVKLVYYPGTSLRRRTLTPCLKGVVAAFIGLPDLLRRRRRPVRPETLAQMDHMLHRTIIQKPEELADAKPLGLLSLLSAKLRYLATS